ncbi:UNVERIFIED_CONTAM: hypothetical protein GTU68_039683 [Idotea baltica]|nr:hypothetical protein [Idotea baltica]
MLLLRSSDPLQFPYWQTRPHRRALGRQVWHTVAVRVLVVEDEDGIAEALRAGLTADGFVVDVAMTGTDGLWLAETNEYAAILLDIMLPGVNGYKITAKLREAGDTTPILMLTAKDGDWDEMEGLDTGADDYITKPFSYPVLLARLRAAIRRSAGSTPDQVLTVGSLKIDARASRVWLGDTEIELSPKAYAILSYLASNAEMVVSKQSIFDNCWDYAFDGDPNIVEVYVSRLRTALEGSSTTEFTTSIQTVRGAGYRLVTKRTDG